jgi:hypothetical protein
MRLYELNVTTKDGHQINTYFETEQGSKYILSAKNESRRIKSVHANTGGADAGLQRWYGRCVFVDPKFEYEANAPQFLIGKGIKIYISEANGKIAFYHKVDGKFAILTWTDAYPKSNKGAKPLVFEFSLKPANGLHAVEFNADSTKLVKSYHFGSKISTVKKLSDLSKDEILAFKD